MLARVGLHKTRGTKTPGPRKVHIECFLILVFVMLAAFPVLVSAGDVVGDGAVIWTDRQDYSPEQTVTIYASGFKVKAYVTVSVTRPDGHGDEWRVLYESTLPSAESRSAASAPLQ